MLCDFTVVTENLVLVILFENVKNPREVTKSGLFPRAM